MLYHRTVIEPHTSYPIPANTHYILMTIQKTVFGLDVVPETILTTLLQNGFRLGDFQKAKKYHQEAYKLPPPTPKHTPVEERPASEEINASTSLGKRHFPGSMAKNSFVVPSRYKQIWIAPATRWIQRPPTPEPATSVFVLQPVHPSSPILVVVAPPAPVNIKFKDQENYPKNSKFKKIVGTMSSTDFEEYRQPWETGPHWELKKEFLKTYENDYPIDRLLCLAQAYSNIELLHCR
ncbi:uncharacterized protein NPIL_319171 [Nephila pilipes]|uniref:XRN2-binding (XTBD) domain-containing protein n=1 Tax=Nephila pilipes TaxID=299642 RepID=A0A8X6Q0M7_NEPPI|nr:uncharacterized protein NPIL_646781 [Nephila pilipes]GFT93065.1 uncharacterized protein NPIL_319171 [Nephila pilipes]